MSWSSRLSRFSPFGRSSTTSTAVDDSDYSYITPSDLAALSQPAPGANPDILIFRHKKVSYPVHFPTSSIDSGKLTIGAARDAAAKKLSDNNAAGSNSAPLDPRRVRMFWKGRNLKDDVRSVRDEGLSSDAQAEILCVIGEPITTASPSTAAASGEAEDEEADSDSDADGTSTPNSAPKRKRVRNRSRKKKNNNKSTAGTGTSTPTTPLGGLPGGGVPLPTTPQTPQAKMAAIAAHFHAALLPLCEAYVAQPPAEKAKRETEHRRITETTLQQVLLKLDGVETEGIEEARVMRRELVREVQGWLTRMDEIVKSYA